MDNLLQNVSRETSEKIERYISLLQKWNVRINLVSKQLSYDEIVKDHFLDCAQLEQYIPEKDAKVLDIGSGAGFPGIVLAILGYSNCTMVEIISKKTTFLKTVLLDLNLPNKVINNDIQKVTEHDVRYIVSRAVASAHDLLELTKHLISKNTTIILLKSKMQADELKEVSKKWNYELQEYQNIYKTEGVILVIKNLSPKCNKA